MYINDMPDLFIMSLNEGETQRGGLKGQFTHLEVELCGNVISDVVNISLKDKSQEYLVQLAPSMGDFSTLLLKTGG